jgi:hypothetical protein
MKKTPMYTVYGWWGQDSVGDNWEKYSRDRTALRKK